MREKTRVWKTLSWLMLALLFVGILLSPYGSQHGYYLAEAKFMAQGLVPWLDFSLMDMPMGIEVLALPYRILGIEATGHAALALMALMQVVNTLVLYLVLRRYHVDGPARWASILFYLLGLFAFGGLHLGVEPFAVFILLLSCFSLRSHRKSKNVLAAILMGVACCFKIQSVVLIPLLAPIILIPRHHKTWHWNRTLLYVTVSIVSLGVVYVGMIMYSDTPNWLSHIDFNAYKGSWLQILLPFIILQMGSWQQKFFTHRWVWGVCGLYLVVAVICSVIELGNIVRNTSGGQSGKQEEQLVHEYDNLLYEGALERHEKEAAEAEYNDWLDDQVNYE